MVSAERNFGERGGEALRNGSIIVAVGGLFVFPEAVIPALLAAGVGEGIRRVSNKS